MFWFYFLFLKSLSSIFRKIQPSFRFNKFMFVIQISNFQRTTNPQNYRWQNIKEYKGKTNWAQSALACLLWLLYRPGRLTDHTCTPRPAGRGEWGWLEGAPWQYRPSPPLHSSLQQSYFEKRTTILASYFSILSSIILWTNRCSETRGKSGYTNSFANGYKQTYANWNETGKIKQKRHHVTLFQLWSKTVRLKPKV